MADLTFRPPRTAAGGEKPDELAADIAERLRSLRRERDWTLDQTSQRTGLSVSALSKIERGELSPTLSSLRKIAAGFGIDVVALLARETRRSTLGRRSITRNDEGALHTTETCRNTWLATDMLQKRMLPIRTRVTARRPEDYSEWHAHPAGETFVYVLGGALVVYSELYEPVRLLPGDSIYYDASTGHKWVSEGEGEAEILWLYAP